MTETSGGAITPADVLRSMTAELLRMRKVIADADVLRPKIRKAERFIRDFADTWSLPIPEETRIAVRPREPKPPGTRVEDPDLECPKCGFQAAGEQGLASHARTQHDGMTFGEVRRLQVEARKEVSE
jgi:hypothetical protein